MNIQSLNGTDFERVINQNKETCIIVFSKESCKVCARLEPTIVKISKDYATSDELHFYAMNVLEDDAKRIFKAWDLVGVPQTVFIKEGVFKDALPGALDEDILRKEIHLLLHPKKSLSERVKNIFKK